MFHPGSDLDIARRPRENWYWQRKRGECFPMVSTMEWAGLWEIRLKSILDTPVAWFGSDPELLHNRAQGRGELVEFVRTFVDLVDAVCGLRYRLVDFGYGLGDFGECRC